MESGFDQKVLNYNIEGQEQYIVQMMRILWTGKQISALSLLFEQSRASIYIEIWETHGPAWFSELRYPRNPLCHQIVLSFLFRLLWEVMYISQEYHDYGSRYRICELNTCSCYVDNTTRQPISHIILTFMHSRLPIARNWDNILHAQLNRSRSSNWSNK